MRSWANLFSLPKLHSQSSCCGAAISLMLVGCSSAQLVSNQEISSEASMRFEQPLAHSSQLESSASVKASDDPSGSALADRPQATSVLSASDFRLSNPRADPAPPSAAPATQEATQASPASDLSKVNIADLATGATPPPSKAELEQAADSWFYGPGLGRTVANVGTVVAFPPYALYLLGNAGLSLAGYDQLFVTDLLPEAPKEAVLGVYDGVTSVPGRMTSLVAGRDYTDPSTLRQTSAAPATDSTLEPTANTDAGRIVSATDELNPGIALNPRPTQSSSSYPRGRLLSGGEVDRFELERVDAAGLQFAPQGGTPAPGSSFGLPGIGTRKEARSAIAGAVDPRAARPPAGIQRIESERHTSLAEQSLAELSLAERKGNELNACRNSSCRNSRQALASGRSGTHAQAGALAAREEHPVSCRNDHC